MSSTFVKTNQRGRVLEITLDRPPANAINQEVSVALHDALRMLQEDGDLRVGMLTGGGNQFFSAGWDLKELAQASSSAEASQAALLRRAASRGSPSSGISRSPSSQR